MSEPGDIVVAIVCGLAMLAATVVAHAQGLADPTRPPAAVDGPAPAAGAPAAPTGLQTIIRRAGAKPAAVINGEYVELGGRIGDARVVKIGEDSVTLKSAAGLEMLKLMPGVEKSSAANAGREATGGGTKK